MKSFLEEYGIVIVVALVIIALIGVGLWFSQNGTEAIKGWLERFEDEAELTAGGGGGGE